MRKGATLTEDIFEQSAAKMREHGMTDMAVAQFKRLYEVWRNEEASSWIREEEVEPLTGVPSFHDVYETINHDKVIYHYIVAIYRLSRCMSCVT